MARKGLRLDLRAALHQAAKSGLQVVHEGVTLKTDGGSQRINLIVRPMHELGDDAGLFLVVFMDMAGQQRKTSRKAVEEAGACITDQLEGELRSTKDHLQSTIEAGDLERGAEVLERGAPSTRGAPVRERGAADFQGRAAVGQRGAGNGQPEPVRGQELDTVNNDLQTCWTPRSRRSS